MIIGPRQLFDSSDASIKSRLFAGLRTFFSMAKWVFSRPPPVSTDSYNQLFAHQKDWLRPKKEGGNWGGNLL
jgi:hypothetical protein